MSYSMSYSERADRERHNFGAFFARYDIHGNTISETLTDIEIELGLKKTRFVGPRFPAQRRGPRAKTLDSSRAVA